VSWFSQNLLESNTKLTNRYARKKIVWQLSDMGAGGSKNDKNQWDDLEEKI
jgi:hypothetical protein